MDINYFYIDDLNLRDNINFQLVPIGIFEGDREVIMNDLYTAGQSYNRGKIKERKILLKGYVKGDILTNLFKLKRMLFKDGLKTLTIGILGMPVFSLQVDLLNWASDEVSPEIISCQLVAPDPYLYAVDAKSTSLGSVSNVGLTFPFTFPIVFGTITGGEDTINNKGNAVAYPIISVTGTCDTITVENQTTGESMSLDVSLQDSDTLIIDNRPDTRGIYLNGSKRMDLKNGSWISCIPGDNIFHFQRNSLQLKQHCTISLQSRWI